VEPTPTPIPQKTKAVPTPTPTSMPKPTATPKTVKDTPKNTKEAEASKNLSNKTKTDAEQPVKQAVSKQETKKFTPIVTPYDITVNQLAVCSKVSNRTPTNCGDEFSLSKTGRIYTWMKVSGVKPPKVVKHIYYWEGTLIATVKLKLKYASMRTWSQKTFKPSQALGKWKVAITTETDEVITVKEFTVVE
jgi:hypothetical protein